MHSSVVSRCDGTVEPISVLENTRRGLNVDEVLRKRERVVQDLSLLIDLQLE